MFSTNNNRLTVFKRTLVFYFLKFKTRLYAYLCNSYPTGNIRQSDQFGQLIIQQDKVDQRMGSTLFSSGEFFVVSTEY